MTKTQDPHQTERVKQMSDMIKIGSETPMTEQTPPGWTTTPAGYLDDDPRLWTGEPMAAVTVGIRPGDTVRYIAEVIKDPTTRKPWTVADVASDGVVTLTPAAGNDNCDTARTVYYDQLELV